LSEQCEASKIAVGSSDNICPFLKLSSPGFYRCLLVELEESTDLDPLIKNALAIGFGCTNDFKSPNQGSTAD
jgi:hypothetical protein